MTATPSTQHEQPANVVLWPDEERGPWLITTTWARLRGRVECVAVEIRGYRQMHESWAEGRLPDALPIDSVTWRRVPVAKVIRTMRERQWAASAAAGESLLSGPAGVSDEIRADVLATQTAWAACPERGPLTREGVAEVYRLAHSRGEPPTKAVEREFRISASAAAKQVARARAAGLLPPTTRGRAR